LRAAAENVLNMEEMEGLECSKVTIGATQYEEPCFVVVVKRREENCILYCFVVVALAFLFTIQDIFQTT